MVNFDMLLADKNTPDTLRASALYAKAWITKRFKADTTFSDSLFELIVANYPGKEVAKQSQIELGQEVTVVTRRDSAWIQFKRAEDLRFESEGYNKEVYYAYLVSAYKYPDIEDVAAQALFVAGREANKRARGDDGTLDTATVKIYSRLCTSYPASPQCQEVISFMDSEVAKQYSAAYTALREKEGDDFAVDTASIDTVDTGLFDKDSSLSPPELPDFNSWI